MFEVTSFDCWLDWLARGEEFPTSTVRLSSWQAVLAAEGQVAAAAAGTLPSLGASGRCAPPRYAAAPRSPPPRPGPGWGWAPGAAP